MSVEEDADPLMSDGARDQLKRERSSPVNCANEVLHVLHSLLSKGGDRMVPVSLDFSISRCSRGPRLYTHSSDLLFSKHGVQGRFASHLCTSSWKQNKRRGTGVKGDELTRFLVLIYRARRSKQETDQISNPIIRLVAPHSGWILTDTLYTPLPTSKCSPHPASSPTHRCILQSPIQHIVSSATHWECISSRVNQYKGISYDDRKLMGADHDDLPLFEP